MSAVLSADATAAFGVAAIGPSVDQLRRRRRRPVGGRPAQKHDCGKYGNLTVNQIAAIAGCTSHAIRGRLRLGWKGEALCTSVEESRRVGWRKRGCTSPTMVTAVRLALSFPSQLPTADQIQAVHPMTRDNATRWRSAIRDARMHLGLPL